MIAGKVAATAVMQQEIRSYSARFNVGGIPLLKQALARKVTDYSANVRCLLR